MKRFVLLFSCILLIPKTLFSRTAEEGVFSSLKYAIELYREERSEVPKNWVSMEEFGFSITLNDAREMLDIENRYFFPNLQTVFTSGAFTGKRIVLMAKKAGDEGSLKKSESETEFRMIDGRFVVLEVVETGAIDSGRIPESQLNTMFQKEGLNLADYTFEAPPKPDLTPKADRPSESVRHPCATTIRLTP